MAAQNTPAQNILDAAKQSEQKFTATNFVDVINQMVQNNFVVNNRNMWFRTRGNTVKAGSTDTAVTETVVDVAKTVKNIALSTSDSTATITLSGVSTSLKSVDVIAGILRVMGFYDSDKMTVKEFAEKLYKEIDLMECDRLSQDTIRGIIVNVSGDSKIEVEKKTINYIYKQLIDKGITSGGLISGGVIEDTNVIDVRQEGYGTYINSKPQQIIPSSYETFVNAIPEELREIVFKARQYMLTSYPDKEEYFNSEKYLMYIVLYHSKLLNTENGYERDEKWQIGFRFLKKENPLPYVSFGTFFSCDAGRDNKILNPEEVKSFGTKLPWEESTSIIGNYSTSGYISWSKTKININYIELSDEDREQGYYGYKKYYETPRLMQSSGASKHDHFMFSNDDLNNLQKYTYPIAGYNYEFHNSIDGSGDHIPFEHGDFDDFDDDTATDGRTYKFYAGSVQSNGVVSFHVSDSVYSSLEEHSALYEVYDNFTKDGQIGNVKPEVVKPNFSSRIDATNDDLVGQLNMSTEDYGRYDATGEIGRNVYAIFNPDAGSSKTLADADKITNGNVTNNQKHNAEDTTSEATNETEDDDSIGDSTGTSTDEGIIPHLKPQYIAKRSMCNLYRVNQTAVRTLTDYLWSTDITNTLRKMYADPMDCILGLYVLPFAPQDVTESVDIYLGNVNLNTKAGLVNSYQEEYVAGVIEVRPYNHDVRDFSPYSEYYMYLPYIGIVELNAEDVVGAKLTIYYDVDLISGSILAKIQVERGNMNVCLYQFAGSCIYRLPISKSEMSNIIDISANSALGIATSVATGSIIPAAVSASQTAMHAGLTNKVSQGQMIAGNANIMANTQPYMIIKHKTPQTPTNFNKFYGKPTFKTVTLKNQSGFTKVRDINLSNIPLTSTEIDELENILKEGVII